ncbi:MAG: putative DNA primase/helicase [Psychrobacter glaciei]|jgi:putative DNA primase/helicase
MLVMGYRNKVSNNEIQGVVLEFANDFGLDVDHIIQDGTLHRVKTYTQPKKRNGWYICDSIGDFLVIGDWQTGLKKVWQHEQHLKKYQNQIQLEQERRERRIAKVKMLANEQQEQRVTAQKATKLYNSSKVTTSHPYLKAKRVNSITGIKIKNDRLLIPLLNIQSISNDIENIQSIYPNGEKRFMKGGRVKGLCFPVGELHPDLTTIYIAEGFSTAATVHCITSDLVLAAMNAGNLKAVALLARKRWPLAKIIIAGDDDWCTQMKTGINVGTDKAKEAASSVGGFTCIPPFTDKQREANLTDWNDYLLSNEGGTKQWKI